MSISIKRLVKHSAVYALGNVLRKSLSVLILPVITRFMPASEYGLYSLLMATNALLGQAYSLGLGQAATRMYFDFESGKQRRKYLGSVWLVSLVVTLSASLILTLLGRPLFARLLGSVPFWPHVVLTIWATFLGLFGLLPYVLLRIEERSWQFITIVVGNAVLTALFSLILVVHFHLNALGLVLAVFLTTVVFALVFSIRLRRALDLHVRGFPVKRWLRASLLYGLPIVLLNFGWIVLESSDRFLLRHYLSLQIVGFYSLGYAVSKVINYITDSLDLAWAPFFYRTASEEAGNAPKVFAYAATYYAALLIFLGLAIVVFRRELIGLMAPREYWAAIRVTPVIVVASLFRGFYNIPARGLYQEKRTYVFPFVVLGGAGMNIILNVLMIPRFGMMGAAWATAFSYGMMFLATLAVSQRAYPIPYEYGRLAKLIASAACILIIVEGLSASFSILGVVGRGILVLSLPFWLKAVGFFESYELRVFRQILTRRVAMLSGRMGSS